MKTAINKKAATLTLLVASLAFLLGSTGCTNMLTAKFESDAIGGLPDKTLPGAPTGDEMTYASEIENQLQVVATPEGSGKSLRYQSLSPSGLLGGHGGWVSFRAKSTNFSKAITFMWTATKVFSGFNSDLTIDFSDGSGIVAARIKIEADGDVILINDLYPEDGETIGNLGNNIRHTVILTVDLPNGEYNFSILKPGGNLTENGRPLITQNIATYHNPARPSLSFKYGEYDSSSAYIIDEVFISRRNN